MESGEQGNGGEAVVGTEHPCASNMHSVYRVTFQFLPLKCYFKCLLLLRPLLAGDSLLCDSLLCLLMSLFSLLSGMAVGESKHGGWFCAYFFLYVRHIPPFI